MRGIAALLTLFIAAMVMVALAALLVMLSISRAVIEGEDMLQTMGEIETEALKLDREALATRVLMLGAFLDKVKKT